ncbi:AraC family transcriptional regulator [Sinimarinibacterium flocculans]|uniref:AraC family transcriptional regulator n=1 Tax=Sinimarinibacterium flocculans TaxID=985250 RepID=UPI0035146633
MAGPSTLSSWAAAVAAALRARGIDARALLLQAGLDPGLIAIPGARYPAHRMTRFWALAIEATEPALALEVPDHVQPGTMHALGSSLAASRSLAEALLRIARYSRLVSDAADVVIETEADRIGVVYRPPPRDPPLAPAAFEAFMASAVRLARQLSGTASGGLLGCEFRHAAPPDPRPYREWFAAPVRFGAPRNRLLFDRRLAHMPLPGADEHEARHHDAVAAGYLARFDAQPVARRVREVLIRHLPSGEPTRAALAQALHLTPRTLLRRLAAEHTNWKTLLNELRCELAQSYLRQGRSAAEITYLLGFADPANFTRAFRRWTGMPPRRWISSERGSRGRAGSS